MFGNKKVEAETKAVVCDKCKHLVLETSAKKVLVINGGNYSTIFFCPQHTPEYDEKHLYPKFRVATKKDKKLGFYPGATIYVGTTFRYYKRVPAHLEEIKIKE